MKIYDSNMSGVPASGAQHTQETQRADRTGAGHASSGVSAGGDRVEFSGNLGRLSQTLASFQSDRSARVQALAAQYQSGTYQANSKVTSRAIVSEALGGGVEAGLE